MDQSVGPSIVRLAADFDRWDDLLALIRRAFAYMDGVIDPPSSAHLLTADSLGEKAKREAGFMAVENGRIVGCVFALERERDFYVGKLAVEPRLQGQGIGARLMRAVERVTADKRLHTPDLGGKAKTADVTAAVVAALAGDNL